MASDNALPSTSRGAKLISSRSSDPAEFELILRPWDLLCTPLSAGDFRHQITAIHSEKFVLYRERYSLSIKLQGLSPEGMFGLCVPIERGQELSYWGTSVSQPSMVATLPGSADAVLGSGYAHAIALVAIDHLRQAIPSDDYERLEEAAGSHVLTVSPRLVGDFSGWSNSLLYASKSHPGRFQDPVFVETVYQQLIDFLLRLSADLPHSRPIGKRATRQLGLSRALDYLRHRLDARVSVADLCRVAGVSERTLHYAFRDEFGVSPNTFMRQRRLHAVRRLLTTSVAAESSVSQIALAHGFSELGRFAVDYRRLFGVHPSDTLKSRS